MKKILFGVFIFLNLLLCLAISFVIYGISEVILNPDSEQNIEFQYIEGNKDSTNKILILKITGLILDNYDDTNGISLDGITYGDKIKQYIEKASSDDSIKGIILEINSGGGTMLGSKTIADSIGKYIDKTKKPVIAHIRGLVASGAYLVASSASHIYADYGSLTGSIGVIYGTPFKYYDKVASEGQGDSYVVTQNGIETIYISAGEYKDLGNPYRKMTSNELDTLKAGINSEYNIFVKQVSEHRNIPEADIINNVKALIYSNSQALELKLIDKEMAYSDTISQFVKDLELKEDDYQLVKNKTGNAFSNFLRSETQISTQQLYSPLMNRVLLLHGYPDQYSF